MEQLQSHIEQSVTFSSWRKVEARLNQILQQNLEKKLMDPINRQIIFQILGTDFVQKCFPSYTNSPAVLDNIQKKKRDKRFCEMRGFIMSVMTESIQKNGIKSDVRLQSAIAEFSEDIKNIVNVEFGLQLSKKKQDTSQRSGLSETYLSEFLSTDENAINNFHPILQRNLFVLTDNLRRLIWPAAIRLNEKATKIRNLVTARRNFRDRYSKLLQSGELDTGIQDITSEIQNIYKNYRCLDSLNTKHNINSTATLLKVCNENGHKDYLHFVSCATAIQQVFCNSTLNSDEDYGNAVAILDHVLRLCLLTRKQINNIVSKIIDALLNNDNQILHHIKQRLHEESDPDAKMSPLSSVPHTSMQEHRNLVILLNNWIFEVFVTVLKPASLLFVWDQLFFWKWSEKIFQDVSLTIFGLIKPWIMFAKNKEDMHRVFSEEPSYLYLLDIQRALNHIQRGGDFLQIPAMNRNISYNTSGLSLDVPRVPATTVSKPVRKFIPWMAQNKNNVDVSEVKIGIHKPFDLYLDSVRFVPDNATIVKITGKMLNLYLGEKNTSKKFQVLPELSSYWRYPDFKFKQTFNQKNSPINPDAVIMLKLYTVEKHSKMLCILGTCLFAPFSSSNGKNATLRLGGHQIRVRQGIPNPDVAVEHLLSSHLDDNPIIPGVTILLRVLPNKETYIPAPEYESQFYSSEMCIPTKSEQILYDHYKSCEDLHILVRDVSLLLCSQSSVSDPTLEQMVKQYFQQEGTKVEDFPFQRFVRYGKEHGLMVLVDKAAGFSILMEGRYLQCLVQIFPGEDTKLGNGKSQVLSFLTQELDLDSHQRAPDWADPPKRLHPEYDGRAFILVTLYDLIPRFDPVTQRLLDKEGRDPKFGLEQAVAWTALHCFEKGSVKAGMYQIPLFKGKPSEDIVTKLSYLPLDFVSKKFKIKVFDTASLEISVWDGRFSSNECPPLTADLDLLNISGNPSKYIKASQYRGGATFTDLLRHCIQGSSDYEKQKSDLIRLLKLTFKNNLNDSLLKHGYSEIV